MAFMSTSMVVKKPSPDTNLCRLDAAVFHDVAEILDINRAWEKLIGVLPRSHYSAQDVARQFEKEYARPFGSPAKSLLLDMGMRGFTVSDLVAFLEKLQFERALVSIKAFQPVSLATQMQTVYRLQGGPNSCLEIECTAVGFPRPTYQWFKLVDNGVDHVEWVELVNQCGRTLVIKPVRLEDEGLYNCRFSNFDQCTNELSYACTDNISVIVKHEMFVYDDKQAESRRSLPPTPLEIIGQPSCPSRGPFYQGSRVILECIAVGFQPISYEWLKNGRNIPGENGTTLNVIIQPEEDVVRFKYQCRVSNAYDSVMSDLVTIAVASPREGPQFLAEDKVALVIANDEYREHAGLRSAVTDAITIAQLLSRLGFKVLAAINLDEEDMRNIVGEFCKLLDSGVYGVFYYAGHGFEVNKQCYMMPVDVERDFCCARCVCVEEVKGKMQNRNPALCCLLLDMCRKDPDCDSFDASRGYQLYQNRVDRNVICAYATSYSCPALDGPVGKNGLFVKHLRNYITKDWPIEVVLNHVFEDISVDPAASRRQFPSIGEKTLAQTRRSLADRIHAMLPNCEERNQRYLNLIRKPSNFMIRCEAEDASVLHIHVTFDMEEQVVCNALVIRIHVTDKNEHPQLAFTSCLGNLKPAYMLESLDQKPVEGENLIIVTVRNLQKLKDPLIIEGNMFHNNRILSVWPEKCLNYPLLSNVARHWEVIQAHSSSSHCLSVDDESGIGSFTSSQKSD